MALLRVTQAAEHVETLWEADGQRFEEQRPFSFHLSAQDAEDIRWYLEDYWIYPVNPQPVIARRIEQRMNEVGRELFQFVFAGSAVWERARAKLGETRIEIDTGLEDAPVPWELIRDPAADLPLALHVPAFVRRHARPALPPDPPGPAAGKIRILLTIARLEGDQAPFRSVARHLLRGLSDGAREPFSLEVLRPATFDQLARRLRAAQAQGQPFHVVHFDGHGSSGEVLFENPALPQNAQPVKAAELGRLLHETHVPLLILNACRSAHSQPPEQPSQAGDLHERIRQFGSLAQAVMDYGAAGVVAWRYNVFVDTAAQYMADLYGALASGLPLGEAATMARKQLQSAGRPIADWTVPVVFETAPMRLFPRTAAALEIKLEPRAPLDAGLPPAPDLGFVGRDEPILQLDRALHGQSVVLLHGYAGSGKTSTVAEFARWYRQTGGVAGPVLFTSFEQHTTLAQVLDQLARAFAEVLRKSRIPWLTLPSEKQRAVSLQILEQFPLLWIWDNVEPVAGFPAGNPSAWTAAEQAELADFLRAAHGSKARFLLTSRRDERDWLHDLPARIELPPMSFDECVRMTEELARKLGRRLEDVEDWRPLLRFTQGNPLTVTVVAGQALRDGLRSREQIEAFVERLEAGEPVFEDEASEGRTRSLGASLAYGFENTFREAERKQLALLYFFQGFVHVNAFGLMGNSAAGWCLAEVGGLAHDACVALFDRAAEVGLLMKQGRDLYRIHPAVPWFFRRLFEQHYAATREAAVRAFCGAEGAWGNHLFWQYERGDRAVVAVLAVEEANLLHARRLARAHGLWKHAVEAMQGLKMLYQHTGRTADWARVVEGLVPDFMDPSTHGPLPGREPEWRLVAQYQVGLATMARRWEEAERLQRQVVDWVRSRAGAALAQAPNTWDAAAKELIRSLSVTIYGLAEIQRERHLTACVEGYQESLRLAEARGDFQAGSHSAFNLGVVYVSFPEIRDLALAEKWYRRSLELCPPEDKLGISQSIVELGTVAYHRAEEARQAKRPAEQLRYLQQAERYYLEGQQMTPPNAPESLVTVHHQLGNVYSDAGQMETALRHYEQSIRHAEAIESRFLAGRGRLSAAAALGRAKRYTEARDWGQAALRDFEATENAGDQVVQALSLLRQIESDQRATGRPS